MSDENLVFRQQEFEAMTNVFMKSASEALSFILKSPVVMDAPRIEYMPLSTVEYAILEPVVYVKACLTSNVAGDILLIFRQRDVQMFLNELMGVDDLPEPDFEFDEVATSAANEIMNQMLHDTFKKLAAYLENTMDTSDCKTIVQENAETPVQLMGEAQDCPVTVINFNMLIKDMVESECMLILSPLAEESLETELKAREERISQKHLDIVQPQIGENQEIILGGGLKVSGTTQKSTGNPSENDIYGGDPMAYHGNIDLIMDVPLNVSVEIGKTRRKLKDILGFNNGTVIELEKQADAPADIIVNGQLIARGEVLVVDDNFGIRVTEIINTKNFIGNGDVN